MQPRVMNQCRIRSENRRLYRWMPGVGKTATERDLNDVFEVKLNFIGCQRIRKPIERLLQLCFEILEDGYDSFNSRLVDHTARSINRADVYLRETQRLAAVSSVARIVTQGSTANEQFSPLTLLPSALLCSDLIFKQQRISAPAARSARRATSRHLLAFEIFEH